MTNQFINSSIQENNKNCCSICKGPFHPSCGSEISETMRWCGVCTRNFIAWYKARMAQMRVVKKGAGISFYDAAQRSIRAV